MSKMKNICECPKCAKAREIKTNEWQLLLFVGENPYNIKCDLTVFQNDLDFDNALHWDVGFCGEVRYIIYRKEDGILVAWYDLIEKYGYSSELADNSI
jgi:hypothetical protein